MIWLILETRAEFKKFHSFFGSNENKKICFWNLLTFRKGGYYYVERLRVEDPKIKFRSNQPSRSPSICRPAPQRRNDSSSSCYWEWPEISLEQENGTTHPTYKVAFYARLETIEVSPPTMYQWGQNYSEFIFLNCLWTKNHLRFVIEEITNITHIHSFIHVCQFEKM